MTSTPDETPKQRRGLAKTVQNKYTLAPQMSGSKRNKNTIVVRIYYDPSEPRKTRAGYPPKPRPELSDEELIVAIHNIKKYCFRHGGVLLTYNGGDYFLRIVNNRYAWRMLQTFVDRSHLIAKKYNSKGIPDADPDEPEAYQLSVEELAPPPPPEPKTRGRKPKS